MQCSSNSSLPRSQFQNYHSCKLKKTDQYINNNSWFKKKRKEKDPFDVFHNLRSVLGEYGCTNLSRYIRLLSSHLDPFSLNAYDLCTKAHVWFMCTFRFHLEPPLLGVFSFGRISLSLGHVLSYLDLGANNKNENQKEQGILLLQGTNKVISSRFFIVYMRKFRPRKTSAWLNFHNWLALTRRDVRGRWSKFSGVSFLSLLQARWFKLRWRQITDLKMSLALECR